MGARWDRQAMGLHTLDRSHVVDAHRAERLFRGLALKVGEALVRENKPEAAAGRVGAQVAAHHARSDRWALLHNGLVLHGRHVRLLARPAELAERDTRGVCTRRGRRGWLLCHVDAAVEL